MKVKRPIIKTTGAIDKYPEKDSYIPQASREADKLEKPKTDEWSRAFLRAMNTLLHRDGLRVL